MRVYRFSLTNTEVHQLLNLMPKMLQQNPYTMLERDVLPQPDPHQCPYPLNVACTPHAPYRMYDGRCNNLARPLWGSSHQPLARFLPPNYADGKMRAVVIARLENLFGKPVFKNTSKFQFFWYLRFSIYCTFFEILVVISEFC